MNGIPGERAVLQYAALRWLLVVSVARIPLVFDPFDPGRTLVDAKRNAVWAVGGLVAVLWVLRWVLDRRPSPRLELCLALPALAAALGEATWQAANPHIAF